MSKPPPRRSSLRRAKRTGGLSTERYGGERHSDRSLPEVVRPQRASGLWLYGVHAVLAAVENRRRRILRALLSEDVGPDLRTRFERALSARGEGERLRLIPRDTLNQNLPEGAVHQGLAIQTLPLDQPALEQILDRPLPAEGVDETPAILLLLDQVSDPQNVGAILRSATAFGASGVVTTTRNAPPETGALAKAASGALEHMPYLQVPNLARALDRAKQAGYLCLGLAGEAETTLPHAPDGRGYVLVLGAEGKGLRRLTRERCDMLVRLPTAGVLPDLNVSNAAAVALYDLSQRRG